MLRTTNRSVLALSVFAVLIATPSSLRAQADNIWQHGGLGLQVMSSTGPDNFSGESINARGWGGIAWAPIAPSLRGYAVVEGYKNPDTNYPRRSGVFNVVFTVPFHHVPLGLVPFVGAGLGLGGGEPGITPVLSGGALWSKGPGLVPFAMVERLTGRDRTILRLGVMLGF